tara:strand:- start:4277 stop:4483 length:207 start_codon:yes stop_codon:yes gene_type:complete
MTTQKLIKEYESKVLSLDNVISKIIELIRKGRKGDTSIDMDDLREEKANANSRRQIYIQFIQDLKTIK